MLFFRRIRGGGKLTELWPLRIKRKVEEDKKSAELQALNKKLFQEEQEKQAALKQQEAEDSFYQKLADGFDVNVLIVGDSIGAGTGTETDGQQWYT